MTIEENDLLVKERQRFSEIEQAIPQIMRRMDKSGTERFL